MINKEPVSASRYVDYEQLPVPRAIVDFSRSFCQAYGERLPPIFVLDIEETTQGLQLVEMNPYESSGRYASNDPGTFYDAIHQQYNHGRSFPFRTPKPVPNVSPDYDIELR